MNPAPANPVPPADGPSRSRSAQAALAGCILLLGLFAIYRLYVPSTSSRPTEDAPPRRQIDLNRADRQELLQVPGLGPSNADAILAYRAERGPFESLDDLTHVHGIGPKTSEKVKPWLHVGPTEEPVEKLERKPVAQAASLSSKGSKLLASDAKIEMNSATEAELQRLPGIGPSLAGRIVQYRTHTPFVAVEDLRKVKGIGAKTLDAIRAFIVVEKK